MSHARHLLITTKARELHNEHCVKGCNRVIGSWWLTWAENELIAEAAPLGDTNEHC
jgi:hypothetical protein